MVHCERELTGLLLVSRTWLNLITTGGRNKLDDDWRQTEKKQGENDKW